MTLPAPAQARPRTRWTSSPTAPFAASVVTRWSLRYSARVHLPIWDRRPIGLANGTCSSRQTTKGNTTMGSRLFVANLSDKATEAGLRTAFEAGGRRVDEVALIMDRDTGRPKGFAFVQMGSEQEAKAALAALDGKELNGRGMKVSEAKDRPAVGRSD